MRRFKLNKYARLNSQHKEKYLVTQYQTIILDDIALSMMQQILSGVVCEEFLISMNAEFVDEDEVRKFVSILDQVKAIDIIKE